MNDGQIHYENALNMPAAAWHPVSIATAKPYLKAVGLLMTLMIVWAGLCTI